MRIVWYVKPRITKLELVPIEPPVWPRDWPLPRVGESIINPVGVGLTVTHIDWFPHGEDNLEPFVYIGLKSS